MIDMTIPWVTALQLAKKLLPVVIDKAPELLKTFERFRPAPSPQAAAVSDPMLEALQAQVSAHQKTIDSQAETIVQLRTRLSAARRSTTLAWTLLCVTVLFALITVSLVLSRF
jgi:hypothetical protein